MADIRARMDELSRKLVARDVLETAAGLLGAGFFAWIWPRLDSPLARAGAGILVVGSLLIVLLLHLTRVLRSRCRAHFALREFLRVERRRVDDQIRLLRWVALWYVAPILIGVNLFLAGVSHSRLLVAIYLPLTLAFGAWTVFVNLRAARTDLQPLRDELDRCLRELEANGAK